MGQKAKNAGKKISKTCDKPANTRSFKLSKRPKGSKFVASVDEIDFLLAELLWGNEKDAIRANMPAGEKFGFGAGGMSGRGKI